MLSPDPVSLSASWMALGLCATISRLFGFDIIGVFCLNDLVGVVVIFVVVGIVGFVEIVYVVGAFN